MLTLKSHWLYTFVPAGLLIAPLGIVAFQAPAPNPTQIATAADHQRMMDQLHLTSLRRGADGRWRIVSDMDNGNRRPPPPPSPTPSP